MEKLVLLATLLPLFGIFFEGPIGAAAIAGGAVSVPIIIHLLNRRRFKVVTWAAMRFLLAAQKKNSRRMRLEQLLLLAVRCLLLLLLAFAMFAVTPWANAHLWNKLPGSVRQQFARTGSAPPHPGAGRFLFDGLSRRRREDQLRARPRPAGDFVRNSPRGDAFSVVLMSSAGRLVVPEPSENVEKVVAEIEKLRQPHTGADLGSTFTSVGTIVKESPPKYTHEEVFFFTDLQHSTWIAQQSTSLNALLQSFKDQKVTSVFVDVGENLGENGAANLAVTGVSLLDDVATTERPTPILFTLHNYGAKTRRTSPSNSSSPRPGPTSRASSSSAPPRKSATRSRPPRGRTRSSPSRTTSTAPITSCSYRWRTTVSASTTCAAPSSASARTRRCCWSTAGPTATASTRRPSGCACC